MREFSSKQLVIIFVGAFIFFVIIFQNVIAALFVVFLIYNLAKKYLPGINSFSLNNKFKTMPETIEVNRSAMSKVVGGTKKIVYIIIGIIVVLWLVSSLFVVIDAGTTGVYSLFGKVSEREFSSGFHIINPLANIDRLSIRTEEYTMSRATNEGKKTGDDSISALTKEGLNVSLDITTLYHLEEQKASDVYREVGLDYAEKIIRPEIRSAIREVIAQYDAKEIYSEKRQEAGQAIFEHLEGKLTPRGIILEEVLVRDVSLPQNLAQAIQEKLKAEQEAQKYDFVLQSEKKEAERKVIEAEGQRDSQRIINESLTDNYLYFQYINQLKDRQGTIYVPVSPSTGMPMFKDLGK